jgi:hypothetical protein
VCSSDLLPDDPPWATPLAWATRRGHARVVALLNEFKTTGKAPGRAVSEYERLAADLGEAFRTGDAPALQRLQDHYQPDRALTKGRVREQVRQRLEKPANPENESESGELAMDDARLMVARTHGFENWEELVKHAAA